ncbi:MAG: VTT domain-containing protein, partial [Hydrogenophaga sp.]|nr:VTT domain-containing protein [Hydrogenophaga sp.]
MNLRKVLLLVAVLLGIMAFFALGLDRYFSLAFLKESQASLAALREHQPLQLALGFFLVYVAVTALSLPGAVIVTLAGGAIFGLGWGLLLVSFASSVGATLAFLTARFLLRDSVQSRFGQRLADVDKGIQKDGAFYLFTLRLIPVVPFFVVNLLMGLTKMKTWTYYWVSQLGMLAGTAVYVNAGTQLGQLDSLQGILSPGLLGSFVLLGLFPLIARQVVEAVQKRKVYAQWANVRPTSFDRNLIVIGSGAGGLVSAYIAAAVKAKVTLIEAHKMGGDCLNYGCVPSKALIKSAKLAHQMRHGANYGLNDTTPTFSFKAVMQRIHDVIKAIEPHDSVARYTGLGVEVLQGYAKLVNPWTVEIALNGGGTQRLTARGIVIAAGARPFVPPLPGLDTVGYVTSDTLWDEFAKLD